jgi:16S rRNA G1207 methylase RsmC
MNKKTKHIEHYFSTNPKSKFQLSLISVVLKNRNFKFLTSSSVFSKKRVDPGTTLLIETMILPKEGTVLDLGCGYGAIGIVASSTNPKLKVFLTDINSRAIELAKLNIKKNKILNAKVRRGHLYEPVNNLVFDCVLLNPPVSAGMKLVKTMILEAPKIMSSKGVFQMVIRSKIGAKIFPEIFKQSFGNYAIISRKSGYRVLKGEII